MPKSPDAFRTISEVADWLGVQAHVLRFWESKFSQIKPIKRAGGRRYYRPSDMLLLGGIKKLLHDDGLTIKGVQKMLREHGISYVSDNSQPLDDLTIAVIEGSSGPAMAAQPDAVQNTELGVESMEVTDTDEDSASRPPAEEEAREIADKEEVSALLENDVLLSPAEQAAAYHASRADASAGSDTSQTEEVDVDENELVDDAHDLTTQGVAHDTAGAETVTDSPASFEASSDEPAQETESLSADSETSDLDMTLQVETPNDAPTAGDALVSDTPEGDTVSDEPTAGRDASAPDLGMPEAVQSPPLAPDDTAPQDAFENDVSADLSDARDPEPSVAEPVVGGGPASDSVEEEMADATHADARGLAPDAPLGAAAETDELEEDEEESGPFRVNVPKAAAAKTKPRNIDVSLPDEAAMPAEPRVLSALAQKPKLSPEARLSLRPVLDRLVAHRAKLAAADPDRAKD